MVNHVYNQYKFAFTTLYHFYAYTNRKVPEDLFIAVTPHLTTEERRTTPSYIAVPPMYYKDAVHVLNISDGYLLHISTIHASSKNPNHAQLYAEKHWPNELSQKLSANNQTYILQNPSTLTKEEYPISLPLKIFTTIDNLHITSNEIEGRELHVTGTKYSDQYVCSRCGYFLGLNKCEKCKLIFKDDKVRSSPGCKPIPPEIRKAFEENGHRFAEN